MPMEPGFEAPDVPIWNCRVCPRIEPRAIDPRCDFCSETPVVANEVASDFEVRPGPVGVSTGAWGACGPCHAFITKGMWMELEQRCVASMRRRFPKSSLKDVRFAVQSMQRQFRNHYRGVSTY